MSLGKQGRNDLCHCGSGKKFKQCCMNVGVTKAPAPVKANAQAIQAAWNLFRQGLVADAEAIAHELLPKQPNSSQVLNLIGTICLQQGRTKEAVSYLTKAIETHSKHKKISKAPIQPDIINNLGLAYHEQGELTLAKEQYQRAIKLAPNYADAHYNLHAAVLDVTNLTPSIDSLRKALSINPRDMDAAFMLAVLLTYADQKEAALPYLAQVEQAGKLYQARVDAWQYLQSTNAPLPPIMGSAMQTFSYTMSLAKVDGLVLEFGVRFGNSIHILAGLVQQEIDGFDSFEGLPDEWHHEPKGSYTTKGVIPQVPNNVQLHTGWFDATLPKFLAENEGVVRFINIDCDIYSSTHTVLSLLAPRIVAGTVIVFDEYIGNEHWREDEFKAFQEAVAKYGWQYQYICLSFFTKQVAVKITAT
jgi:TolA-binding protein